MSGLAPSASDQAAGALADQAAGALADQAARDRITGADGRGLGETLFVEAGAGSGKTRSLVDRVVALVGSGVELRQIAAITFTEKAAAELRDRIRSSLEARSTVDPDRRWRDALDQLDGAAVGTLHAFAQRLLTERPIEAGLPPDVEVLDEVVSEIAFQERWERLRVQALDEPTLRRSLLLAFAAGVRVDDLRALTRAFDANWDLLTERVPWPAEEPPPLSIGPFVDALEAVAAERDGCADRDRDSLLPRLEELADYASRLRDAPDEYEQLRLLKPPRPTFRVGNRGRQSNWPDLDGLRERVAALTDQRRDLCDAVLKACLHRLAVTARDFVLAAAEERRARGRLEFQDLLVLARDLLRGRHGREARAALGRRYRRLLLDEFQDTDPVQIELAVLLASDDPDAGAKHWSQVPVTPGALFFVGDPKQSIYRFRRADIGLFLAARHAFGDAPVRLTTSFRATPPLIDWVNHAFARLITHESGSQPEYLPLDAAPTRAAPPTGPPVTLLGAEEHLDAPDAATLREREAAAVADAVVTAVAQGWSVRDDTRDDTAHDETARGGSDPHPNGPRAAERWRPARLGDIVILIPARTSLAALEQALEARGLAYRAETSSLVYATAEIRDLFAALRAVADPTDQLALVTALRSALFGCGDDDLVSFRRRHRGRWNYRAPLPDDLPGDHPVGEAMRYLAALHEQAAWLAPSELLDRLARDRRLFELGFADGRPRDLWRRLRFVTDQARHWSETEGGTLREYLAWARLQASETTRVAETVLPETDDDSVRILTVHAAKGLEFPITILSGLTTASRPPAERVQVLWPTQGPVGLRFGSAGHTPEFETFAPIDEQLGYHERLRLLYVACTRAQDHLVVSLHRKVRSKPTEPFRRTNAELLAEACRDGPHQTPLIPGAADGVTPASRPAPPDPLPDFASWQQELRVALDRGSAPRTVAATGVAGLAVPPEDPGLAKDPRDLDLPPWIKGRYGTAVGRAVHAVLQTIDLATGAGLAGAAAAQAAAEGVPGRERDVARLASQALSAPSVRAAATRPHWRETYVAAPLGDRILEGYIDLLYRSDEGLVVVDYKTAGAVDDLDARAAGYRLQGAAYALALREAVGEPVAGCVFVFLTPDGAHERAVTDLPAAVAEVRALLTGGQPGP